jgi:uncharacterized protein
MTAEFYTDVVAAFVAGLAGSIHCMGMCGPLAAIGCRNVGTRISLKGSLWFVVGKFFSYSVLGLLAGWLGSVLVGSGIFGKATALISLAGGILMLALIAWTRIKFPSLSGGISQLIIRNVHKQERLSGYAPFLIGIAAAFLPCGLLYAMLARSAAAGETLSGMFLMQAFGLGTSPALLGFGIILRWIPQRWSKYANLAGEIILILMAITLIWRGIAGLMSSPDSGPSCCH